MRTSRHSPSGFQTASAVKIRLIPFSPQIQSVGWASMPDMPQPIYGIPLSVIPAQAGIQTFPLWNRGRKKVTSPQHSGLPPARE